MSYIRPILTYASTTWATTRGDEVKLRLFELKVRQCPVLHHSYSSGYYLGKYMNQCSNNVEQKRENRINT